MKKNNYNKTGWWFIRISVFWLLLVVIDYKLKIIFNFSSISDLATILVGPSSICASLAGLFFVLENLELQRKTIQQQQESIDLQRQELQNQILEMKESNEYFKQQTETFKTQTAESTFFQLLDNHRSLISSLTFDDTIGYNGLNRYYQSIKTKNTLYYQAAYTGVIYDLVIASYYPVRLLKPQVENIEQIYSNIYHLVDLIKEKLNNKTFYHQTFYNTLSKAEKYLLGIYCINFKKNDIPVFKSDVFNYIAEFEGSGNSYIDLESVPFFPNLSFNFVQAWYNTSDEGRDSLNPRTNWTSIKINMTDNEQSHLVVLKEISIAYDFQGKDYEEKSEWDIPISESIEINLYALFEKHVYKNVLKLFKLNPSIHVHHFIFKMTFVITSNGRTFKYFKNCNCQATVNNNNIDQLYLQ